MHKVFFIVYTKATLTIQCLLLNFRNRNMGQGLILVIFRHTLSFYEFYSFFLRGVKKGRASYKKQAKSPGETQALDYHLYDDETPLSQLRSGPSGGPVVDPATHDYAAYDEIKEQRQRIAAGSERKKDGGYITPMAQDRPLPPVGGGDGNGYISPKSAPKQPQKGNAGKNGDSPSPPGNGGYLSPLEERKLSSDSDTGSDKSDKSRKYQNEPGKKSPKSKGVYESIKDAGITQEHQYIDLHTTVS